MESLDVVVAGVRLTPCFQRYLLLSRPESVEGELLTRVDGMRQADDFFASLDAIDQLAILEWQVQLQRVIHEQLGARVSINVHNRVVESDETRDRFLELVGRASAPTTFEFTETYPMPPVATSNHLLRDIRTLGHMSALDDFGTGLNGMSLLTDYDFDIIKVDRSLVFDLPSRTEKCKTLRLVREMLEVLGKAHVVEGVENKEVFDILTELGFRNFQGFYVAKPISVAELVTPPSHEVVS